MTPRTPADGVSAMSLSGVSYTYPGGVEAVRGVSLDVRAGERLGVLGPNGGGKSTLLKIALGLLSPSAGTARIFGDPPEMARASGAVGYVPQKPTADLSFPVSVRQMVGMVASLGRSPWGRAGAETDTLVAAKLERVGLTDLADRPVGALSGGQLQRAMIARALVRSPRLLLLDEPMVGIDAPGQSRFGALLDELAHRDGVTIVVVSHDLRTVAATCDRVACLRTTLHYHDSPSGLGPETLAEVFSHDMEAVFGELHVDAHRADACDDPTHAHQHHHHDEGAGEGG